MDTSYVLVNICNKKTIELRYFNFKFNIYYNCIIYRYPICFTAYNAHIMFSLMSLYKDLNFLSTQHKLYLGKELYKAEISIKLNQIYIQE